MPRSPQISLAMPRSGFLYGIRGGDSSVVERRLVIGKLLTPGLILEPAMRRCVLGKDTSCLFPIGADQFTCCGDPA